MGGQWTTGPVYVLGDLPKATGKRHYALAVRTVSSPIPKQDPFFGDIATTNTLDRPVESCKPDPKETACLLENYFCRAIFKAQIEVLRRSLQSSALPTRAEPRHSPAESTSGANKAFLKQKARNQT